MCGEPEDGGRGLGLPQKGRYAAPQKVGDLPKCAFTVSEAGSKGPYRHLVKFVV